MLVLTARSVGPQVSTWLPATPVSPHPAFAGEIDQVTGVTLVPVPPGKLSVSLAPVAVPGPVLVSVMVKPIALPALTEAASATLVIVRFGLLHVIDAFALPVPLLVVVKLAVLSYPPHAFDDVAAVTCTVIFALTARPVCPQVSTW